MLALGILIVCLFITVGYLFFVAATDSDTDTADACLHSAPPLTPDKSDKVA